MRNGGTYFAVGFCIVFAVGFGAALWPYLTAL